MATVYVYTDFSNKKRLEVLTTKLRAHGYHVNEVSNIDGLDIMKNIIISTNEEYHYPIFKKFLGSNIYFMLNDKKQFYTYLNQNSDLLKEGLKLIPHYDSGYQGPNIHKEFLLKDKNGYSAAFNKKMTGNVYDLIKTYGQQNQIQDVMDVKHILGISMACMFGKILGVYSYKTDEAITYELLNKGFNALRGNFIEHPSIRKFLKSFIERINYFGIIEVEFLIDKSDNIYVMECNPRISGSLYIPHYFDWVIIPYIKSLQNRNLIELDIENVSLWQKI